MTEQVRLGQRVRDGLSGFTGVAYAITDYLHGCRRITVAGEALGQDGKPIYENFDEAQLKVVEPDPAPDAKPTGGMRDPLSARPAPTRRP